MVCSGCLLGLTVVLSTVVLGTAVLSLWAGSLSWEVGSPDRGRSCAWRLVLQPQ
jgi:hypothetical protein